MPNWAKIFIVFMLGAGFYLVLNGGVTKEEERVYYFFGGAVLFVFGIIKWDYIQSFLTSKFNFSKKEDPKDPPSA